MVWHSSLNKKNRKNLERVLRAAVRVIMGNEFTNYKNLLKCLNLVTLKQRRELFCLKFAKNCVNSDKVKNLIPLKKSQHKMKKRKQKKFKTTRSKTKRMQKSALPFMRKLLNEEYQHKSEIIQNIPT